MRVIVIGGGYAGLKALEYLVEIENIEIILIDKSSYHYMQTEVYDFIANKSSLSDLILDLDSICRGFNREVKFINREVVNIDFENREIELKNFDKLSYNYLLIAIGSQTLFPDFIEGLREYSYGVKNIPKAIHFKQEFERAIYQQLTPKADKKFSIVVGGAGLSGVEIAAEMAYYAKEFYESRNFRDREINIYLIDAYETILFGLDKFLIEKSMERLIELGVKVLHNSRITKIDKESVYLDDNREINYNFIIFTGGIRASKLCDKLNLEKSKKSHLKIDNYLQVRDGVFAIGDVAEFIEGDRVIPPTAQVAKSSAKVATENIYRLINGKNLIEYRAKSQGILIALGGKYATGLLFNKIRVKGYIAYLIKKLIFFIYKAPLKRLAKIGYRKSIS